MLKKPILSLIVSKPGNLQNGLIALISTIPQIKSTIIAEDFPSAINLIEVHQPSLVIVDEDLPIVEDSIKQIRAKWPKIKLLLLGTDIARIKNSGIQNLADTVLIKGFSADKFISEIDTFFDPEYSKSKRDQKGRK